MGLLGRSGLVGGGQGVIGIVCVEPNPCLNRLALARLIYVAYGKRQMNRPKRRKLNRLLLKRDGDLCGPHIGGCGKKACSNSETDLDHIFSQAFFRDTKALDPWEYDESWNVQRMHKVCNNETKVGFLSGFPVFKCKCHWLQIRECGGKYALEVSYSPPDDDIHSVLVVPYGKFDVGDGSISDPKGPLDTNGDHVVVGFLRAPDRGMSISSVTVDTSVAFEGGRQSFSFVGKTKKGTLRAGENGHSFPLLTPDEVAAFNEFEAGRVNRECAVDDDDNLLATFNSEVILFEMTYDE